MCRPKPRETLISGENIVRTTRFCGRSPAQHLACVGVHLMVMGLVLGNSEYVVEVRPA